MHPSASVVLRSRVGSSTKGSSDIQLQERIKIKRDKISAKRSYVNAAPNVCAQVSFHDLINETVIKRTKLVSFARYQRNIRQIAIIATNTIHVAITVSALMAA